MKITKSQLKHIIKEELLLIMETEGMMRYAPLTGQRIQLASDEEPTMQQMMQRDFAQPEAEAAERRASYSQPTMSADRGESGRALTRTDPAREATPRPENLPARPGDVDYRLPSARRTDAFTRGATDVATTVAPVGRLAGGAAKLAGRAMPALQRVMTGTRGGRAVTTGGQAATSTRGAVLSTAAGYRPTSQDTQIRGQASQRRSTPSGPAPRVTAQAAEPPAETQYVDMPGMEFTARSPSKRDDLYVEHIQRIIEEEINQIISRGPK